MDDYQLFQVGDVVQLKSGGPAMTIFDISVVEENVVVLACQWYSSSGELRYDDFYPEILRFCEKPANTPALSDRKTMGRPLFNVSRTSPTRW